MHRPHVLDDLERRQNHWDWGVLLQLALASVTIPSSVTSIGTYAFYYCTGLTQMTFQGNAPTCGSNWIGGRNANLKIYFYNGPVGSRLRLGRESQALALALLPLHRPDGNRRQFADHLDLVRSS